MITILSATHAPADPAGDLLFRDTVLPASTAPGVLRQLRTYAYAALNLDAAATAATATVDAGPAAYLGFRVTVARDPEARSVQRATRRRREHTPA